VKQERPEREDGQQTDAERPDVLHRDRDASDVPRLVGERAVERLHLGSPDPAGQPIQEDQEPDRDDHDHDLGPVLDRTDHDTLHGRPADEGEHERQRERGPVREAVVHQRPRDVGGEGRHLALGEVDDVGGAVDENERQGEAREDRAGGETAHDLLDEIRHQ